MMMTHPDLDRAVTAVRKGGLIVYPTDTLYGLGADIFNPDAVQRVYAAKQRPTSIPLPVMVSNLTMMQEIAVLTPAATQLVNLFLPGPLTLVLTKRSVVPPLVAQEKIAVRIPDHPLARQLAETLGPLTTTSANLHGGPNPTTVAIAQEQLGEKVQVYLDDGPLPGVASTIVEIVHETPVVLREGAIGREKIHG